MKNISEHFACFDLLAFEQLGAGQLLQMNKLSTKHLNTSLCQLLNVIMVVTCLKKENKSAAYVAQSRS